MGRNLLNRSYEVLGLDQRIWLAQETGGFGKAATGGLVPVSAGAIEHITCNLKFDIPREDSSARSGRSLVTRLSGKKTVDISAESYIMPGIPDGLGHPTLPPLHPFLSAAFGTVDQTDPAKIIYRLSRLNDKSFRILEEASHYSRLAEGCVCESLTFTLPGDGKAQVAMEGFAQDLLIAGESNLEVELDGLGGFDITVSADEGQRFEPGSYIDIISATDGNTKIYEKLKVMAVVGDVLTVDTALNTPAPVGAFVTGHAPDDFLPVTSENALLGLKGTFSFSGFPIGACEVISCEIGLTNNFTKKDFLYGTDSTCGYIPDKRRSVSVKAELLLNKDNFGMYMRNKRFVAEDLTITLEPQAIPAPAFASSVGRTFKFHMPKVEFNIPPIEQPADGYVSLQLEGVAMASDINNVDDELTLTIE